MHTPDGLRLALFRRGLSEGRLFGKRVSVKLWKWFKRGRVHRGGLQGDGETGQNNAIEALVDIREVKVLDDASDRGRTMFLSTPAIPISLCI